MDKIFMKKPSIEDKAAAIDYIHEFEKYHSNIQGVGGLHYFIERYEEWLNYLEKRKVCSPSELIVPGETFFCVREKDQKIVGMIDIRFVLNQTLSKYAGNIAYSIRPTERKKGYGTEQLRLALEICREHKLDKVLVSCINTNIGSAKIIKANGGIMRNSYFEPKEDAVVQNYWIYL